MYMCVYVCLLTYVKPYKYHGNLSIFIQFMRQKLRIMQVIFTPNCWSCEHQEGIVVGTHNGGDRMWQQLAKKH